MHSGAFPLSMSANTVFYSSVLSGKIDGVGQKHTVGFVRNGVHRAVEERRHGQQAEHPDNDQESLFSGKEKKIWKKQMFR